MESWREQKRLQFLLMRVFDPWLVSCWVIVFIVGFVASRGLWPILYDKAGSSLIFRETLDPWLFLPGIDSVTRDEIQTNTFFVLFNLAKALLLALILFSSRMVWNVGRRSSEMEPHQLLFLYLCTLLWMQLGYGWSGRPCSAVHNLVLSPQLTLFGFSLPLLNSWITAPLAEELTFRGVMFHWLSHRSAQMRILFTACLFAYAHVVSATGLMAPSLSLVWTVHLDNIMFVWFPLGMLFGYARERSGGLLLPFLLHAGHNMLIDCESMMMIATGLCHQ